MFVHRTIAVPGLPGPEKFIYNFCHFFAFFFRFISNLKNEYICPQKWQKHWPHSQSIYFRVKTTNCQQQWCCEVGINCARKRSLEMSISATSRLNEQSSLILISIKLNYFGRWCLVLVGSPKKNTNTKK